jgi:hypothetical protein
MKSCHGFKNSFTNLFDYVTDSRNSESEGNCKSCIRRTQYTKPAITQAVKTHSHTLYIVGKNVKIKWKYLRDSFRAELNRMNENKSGDPGLSPSKRDSQWWWLKMLLFFKKYFEC